MGRQTFALKTQLSKWLSTEGTHGDELGSEARDRIADTLLLAGQRLDAADVLARRPHLAESVHILVRALQALEAAVAELKAATTNARAVAVSDEIGQSLQTRRERLESVPGVDAQL